MTHPANRSFRLVASGADAGRVSALLAAQGFAFEPEPFFNKAHRLVAEPFPLGRSLAAFFGCIYIQDRSSMLPPIALAPAEGATVLDMCASPGSKTGLLAQIVGTQGLVLGNEPNSARLATLRRNLQQLNLLHTVTCCQPGERLPMPDASWDTILLDPPCSGWGTTDRHPSVLKLWQGDKIAPLIRLQQALLREAARLLRPGGRLVYSTCTTNVQENEEQARFARDELGLVPVPLPPLPGFTYHDPALPDVHGVLRVDEAASDAQGFFLAGFSKPNPTGHTAPTPAPTPAPAPAPAPADPGDPGGPGGTAAPWQALAPARLEDAGIAPSLLPPGAAGIFGDTVHMLPNAALRLLPPALRWQGTVLGKYSGGLFRPAARLRVCMHCGESLTPRVDIDDTQALIALTQGQSLNLGLPGRVARLFWRDLPLGLLTLKNGRGVWSGK